MTIVSIIDDAKDGVKEECTDSTLQSPSVIPKIKVERVDSQETDNHSLSSTEDSKEPDEVYVRRTEIKNGNLNGASEVDDNDYAVQSDNEETGPFGEPLQRNFKEENMKLQTDRVLYKNRVLPSSSKLRNLMKWDYESFRNEQLSKLKMLDDQEERWIIHPRPYHDMVENCSSCELRELMKNRWKDPIDLELPKLLADTNLVVFERYKKLVKETLQDYNIIHHFIMKITNEHLFSVPFDINDFERAKHGFKKMQMLSRSIDKFHNVVRDLAEPNEYSGWALNAGIDNDADKILVRTCKEKKYREILVGEKLETVLLVDEESLATAYSDLDSSDSDEESVEMPSFEELSLRDAKKIVLNGLDCKLENFAEASSLETDEFKDMPPLEELSDSDMPLLEGETVQKTLLAGETVQKTLLAGETVQKTLLERKAENKIQKSNKTNKTDKTAVSGLELPTGRTKHTPEKSESGKRNFSSESKETSMQMGKKSSIIKTPTYTSKQTKRASLGGCSTVSVQQAAGINKSILSGLSVEKENQRPLSVRSASTQKIKPKEVVKWK